MRCVSSLVASAAFVLSLATTTANSQSLPAATGLPAVSGLNGSLSFDGTHLSNVDFLSATGSISIPISHSFGLQLDAGLAGNDGINGGGGGAHLFWRDPGVGLLGLYGGYLSADSVLAGASSHVWSPAVEGELYVGRLTLGGTLGADILQSGGNSATSFASSAHLAYYLTDDLVMRLGHRYAFESNTGLLQIEAQLAQLPVGGLSLYGSGVLSENGDLGATGGIKLYFGESGKSLIRRNREDDPLQWWQYAFLALSGRWQRCTDGSHWNAITRSCPPGTRLRPSPGF